MEMVDVFKKSVQKSDIEQQLCYINTVNVQCAYLQPVDRHPQTDLPEKHT
mgnify:CR=1 FL=1